MSEPSYTEQTLDAVAIELREELELIDGAAKGTLTKAIQLITQTQLILQQDRRRRDRTQKKTT